ncbi:Thioesterase superfamily protein, partial [mine drainage metagenome]
MTESGWQDNGQCIVCGPRNEYGLHLHFKTGDDGAEAQGTVPEHLQGYAGRAHGGVIAAILDDAMFYAVAAKGLLGVTAEMKVRFKRPLDTSRPFRV